VDQPGAIFLFVFIAVVVGVAIYLSHLAAKKRRETLSALADELGWQFDPGRDTYHDDEYAHFGVFRRGHSRAAYNTLRGSIEVDNRTFETKMGDFTYKVTHHTGKGSQTKTYRFSYMIMHMPFGNIPDLLIRREGIFDKVAGAIGFDDIDFESAEFSKKFYVKSQDKKFAYDVIHPRMMEYLLDTPAPAVDIENGRCCVTDGRSKWKPEEFKPMLNWLVEFFDHWPDHVTSRMQGE